MEFQIGEQIHNDDGGFDISYSTITTVWAGIKQESDFLRATKLGTGGEYIRGEQTSDIETHEFLVRKTAVMDLGRGYTIGFSIGFDSIADINMLKSQWFAFVQEESGSSYKGRRFRLKRIKFDENNKEFVIFKAKSVDDIDDCHVLFISNGSEKEFFSSIEHIQQKNILTVGDKQGLARKGSVINFIVVNNKVQFEINTKSAERANLKISSQLLKIARIVKDE